MGTVSSCKKTSKNRTIKIADRKIGLEHPPFIVAEMSGNHNQSLDRALQIVDAAAKAGAHAMKIQTYTADTMTINLRKGEFMVRDPKSLWAGKTLYELYQEASTPWEWHEKIFDRCKKRCLIGFSTPFDASAVDFLESLNVPCYKIASFENMDIPLIRKAASTGKPLIISTGMASERELKDSVKAARQSGCKDLILLKCTSSYPSPPSAGNIRTITDLRTRFKVEAGLSDHTMGIGVAVASISLGAVMIEKHFTLDRKEGGVDAAFSMEPSELRFLVVESQRAWESLGRIAYGPLREEKTSLLYRRSLYAIENIRPGEVLNEKNVRAIRPGLGLPPKYLQEILGKKARRNISRGTPLKFNLIA